MSSNFEQMLERYADLALRVGLNLQPGQRLLISDPRSHGVSLHAAPLVRALAARAYQLGARLVDVLWGDEEIYLSRFRHAPHDSFDEYPTWQATACLDAVRRGDALLTIRATDPDLLSGQDPELVSTSQAVTWQQFQPVLEYVTRNATNWLVISAASQGWAAKVFPEVNGDEQVARLWDSIFAMCRVDRPDPVEAWSKHLRQLAVRSDYLTQKRFAALRYAAPDIDLTIGMPEGHVWVGANSLSENGIDFVANMPTEEVFTMPHNQRAEGVVRSSRPLAYAGIVIEDFSLEFAGGRVVKANARKGEAVLRKLIETDEGAARLGEVALVPHSSPISQTNRLFYNVLIDENAASHMALGTAYRFTLRDGEPLTEEAFAAAGGNNSLIHVDFMVGSGQLNVDGVTRDGRVEPIMRNGEWAFEV